VEAVGIRLGVCLLLSLAWAYWERRKAEAVRKQYSFVVRRVRHIQLLGPFEMDTTEPEPEPEPEQSVSSSSASLSLN
jgi:hypothetical protein